MADPIKHTPETKSAPMPATVKTTDRRPGENDADHKARVDRTADEAPTPRRSEESKPLVRGPRKDKAAKPLTHEETLAENRERNRTVVEDKRRRGVSEPEIYEDINEDAKLNMRGPMPGEGEEAFRVRTRLDKSKDI